MLPDTPVFSDIRVIMEDVLYGDLIYVLAFCLGGLVFALGPILLQTAVYLPLLAGAALFDLYRKNL